LKSGVNTPLLAAGCFIEGEIMLSQLSRWNFGLVVFVGLMLLGMNASATEMISASEESKPPVPEVRKLAVLLNYSKGDARSIKAEDLEREFSNPKSASAEHSRRFSHPLRVSLLLTHRLPEDYRATLPDDDPEELLHRYVVLEYPDTASTMAAKAILKNDLSVLFVQESTFSEFSVAPSDPLLSSSHNGAKLPMGYQQSVKPAGCLEHCSWYRLYCSLG